MVWTGRITRAIGCVISSVVLSAACSGVRAESLAFQLIGVAKAECPGGIWFGFERQTRNAVSCLLLNSSSTGLSELKTDSDWRARFQKRRGQGLFNSVSDEVIQDWVAHPEHSLVPHDGFRPVRVDGLEFARTSARTDTRFINPTGRGGIVFSEYAGDFAFRGTLISEQDGVEHATSIAGVFRPSRFGNQIVAIKVGAVEELPPGL